MTEPLVPPGVDLRDFSYMPLDVVRLRDCQLATTATGEGFRCAVLLWCASWHQVPAGSLPNDEHLLAKYAGFGRSVREWKKHRDDALHGWVLCTDGRLYHPTVSEKALEAWDQRLHQRWRTECARIKKSAQRAGNEPIYPTFEQWEANFAATGSEIWRPEIVPETGNRDKKGTRGKRPRSVPGDKASKGREGKGREGNIKSSSPSTSTRTDTPQGPGADLARALSEAGHGEHSPHDPHLEAAAEAGVTAAEILSFARKKPDKPLAYWVNGAIGKRRDAAASAAGGQVVTPIDRKAVERAEDKHRLDDAVLSAEQAHSLGVIDEAERDRRITAARAEFEAKWPASSKAAKAGTA